MSAFFLLLYFSHFLLLPPSSASFFVLVPLFALALSTWSFLPPLFLSSHFFPFSLLSQHVPKIMEMMPNEPDLS